MEVCNKTCSSIAILSLSECMIYHRMWDSEACWKSVAEVTAGLIGIKTKGGKVAELKENIRIR